MSLEAYRACVRTLDRAVSLGYAPPFRDYAAVDECDVSAAFWNGWDRRSVRGLRGRIVMQHG
jgi:hypothetical protein